jgi:hypothetical protein
MQKIIEENNAIIVVGIDGKQFDKSDDITTFPL